jgi:DNA-binding MarR family transcriptional regulator
MISDGIVAANCQCNKLRSASRKITRIYDDALRPIGIKANQFTILIAVSLLGPVSITKISDKLGMERTTLTRNLSPLEKEGFVELHAGHGRTRNAVITVKGKAIIKKAKPAWRKAQTLVVKKIGKDNLEAFNQTLESLSK